MRVSLIEREGYFRLDAVEIEGRRRDPDHFSYTLKITASTPSEEVLGWLSNLPDHIALSVLKFIKQHSTEIQSEHQFAETDLHNVNPWTRERDLA